MKNEYGDNHSNNACDRDLNRKTKRNNDKSEVQNNRCLYLSLIHIWAFVQGSSIELSADGPIKEPYAVYFQGGLTWAHAKLGILMSLQKLYEKGIVKEL